MMRLYILLLGCLVCQGQLFSQAPPVFNYQGIAYDDEGVPLTDQELSLRISIVESGVEGSIEFVEEHLVRTNARGVFTLKIGLGFPILGNLRNLKWGEYSYFVRTELDATGGDNYAELGTTQLLSVPYALYAETAGDSQGGTGGATALIFSGNTLSLDNGSSVDLSSLDDEDGDPTNELQDLSVNGSTLSITNGNSVELSGLGGGSSIWQLAESEEITYEGRATLTEDGEAIVSMGANSGDAGAVTVSGPNGSTNVLLTSLTSSANSGAVAVMNANGDIKAQVGQSSNGYGNAFFYGNTGTLNFAVTSINNAPDQGAMVIYGSGGDRSVQASAANDGQGFVSTYGENGLANVRLTWLNNNTDNGYVSVHDGSGNEQAALFVNSAGDGIVTADVKNFRMDHPSEEGMQIVYASLEGPEAAAYVRGTAALEGGKARVYFPDHFQEVLSGTDGMTIMLTPLSIASKGMAVIEKYPDGFLVGELSGGQGSYDFDWEVKGVRTGYEGFQAIQQKHAGGRVQEAATSTGIKRH